MGKSCIRYLSEFWASRISEKALRNWSANVPYSRPILTACCFFRSTPPSRPNKAGLKCPSVRQQNVSSISMKFGMQVEVDD